MKKNVQCVFKWNCIQESLSDFTSHKNLTMELLEKMNNTIVDLASYPSKWNDSTYKNDNIYSKLVVGKKHFFWRADQTFNK